MTARRARTGFRRTMGAAALSVAALAAPALVPTTATAMPKQAAPVPGVDAGTANASAEVVSVAPTAGSLAFAITTGTALAQTTGGLAQALAQTFDLGLIGTSATAEGCDGGEAAVSPEQMPQPTQVDNRGGDAAASSTEVPLAGTTLGGGTEEASATVQPASRAAVTAGDVDLGPVATVDGGRATVEAEVFPGAGREARSTAELNVHLAGAVDMSGLRWSARHRTGAEPGAEGSFSIDALEVAGVPVPTDDLAAAEEAVNAALAPTGFRVEMPRVERLETPVDLVRVTPLRILIADSPLGAAGVRPALEATREARSALFENLTAAMCQFGDLLLIGEIGVGVASGTGALVLELGGVEARTADVAVEDPFGTGGFAAPVVGLPTAGSPGGPGGPVAGPGAPPAGAPPIAPATGSTPLASTPIATERVCETTHPFNWPDCSRGAAGVVGIVGAATTAAMAFLDLRRRRGTVA